MVDEITSAEEDRMTGSEPELDRNREEVDQAELFEVSESETGSELEFESLEDGHDAKGASADEEGTTNA